MPFTVPQVLNLLRQRKGEIGMEMKKVSELSDKHDTAMKEVNGSLEEAEGDLQKALLPTFTDFYLNQVSAMIGLPYLSSGLPQAMEKERQQLQARLAEIDADPRYVDRYKLRDPVVGTITHRLNELQGNIEALEQNVRKMAHPRLEELIRTSYGTPDYKVGFWRLSYYLNWKAGDEILARYPGKTFAQIREEYISSRDAIDPLKATYAEVNAEMMAGQNLEVERIGIVDSLAGLETKHLGMARKRMMDFLRDTPEALTRVAETDTSMELLAKRVAGLNQKKGYLEGMAQEKLEKPQQALQAEKNKLDQTIDKLSRPKNAGRVFTDAEIAQKYGDPWHRHNRIMAGFDKYENQYDTVNSFNNYDQGSLVRDFLWWDLMTHNRFSGDYLPQVSRFREENPNWRYTPPPADDTLAAASSANDWGSGGGTVDVS